MHKTQSLSVLCTCLALALSQLTGCRQRFERFGLESGNGHPDHHPSDHPPDLPWVTPLPAPQSTPWQVQISTHRSSVVWGEPFDFIIRLHNTSSQPQFVHLPQPDAVACLLAVRDRDGNRIEDTYQAISHPSPPLQPRVIMPDAEVIIDHTLNACGRLEPGQTYSVTFDHMGIQSDPVRISVVAPDLQKRSWQIAALQQAALERRPDAPDLPFAEHRKHGSDKDLVRLLAIMQADDLWRLWVQSIDKNSPWAVAALGALPIRLQVLQEIESSLFDTHRDMGALVDAYMSIAHVRLARVVPIAPDQVSRKATEWEGIVLQKIRSDESSHAHPHQAAWLLRRRPDLRNELIDYLLDEHVPKAALSPCHEDLRLAQVKKARIDRLTTLLGADDLPLSDAAMWQLVQMEPWVYLAQVQAEADSPSPRLSAAMIDTLLLSAAP